MTQMPVAANQIDRLTPREWPLLVGRGCASAAARFEMIAEGLVEAARLRAGDAVLDVATGAGDAAIAAARCGCVVTAVDDVDALLARGLDRTAAEGLSVTFAEGDAEHLPNQSADPLLVNPVVGAAQDFHIASPNSPLIGAGTADASGGPSDRDGVPHPDPPAIGAYEYTGPPAAPSGTPAARGAGGSPTTAPGGGSATTGPTSGRHEPIISQLAASHTVFAVASTSTPLRGRTAAHSKRGTTFLFGLDQPAMVTIVITTSARCRRTTPRTARNRRCARTVVRLTRSGHAGFNKLPFSGRIRGRPLKRGDYRAVFAATSPGGTSDPKTLRFRIVRR